MTDKTTIEKQKDGTIKITITLPQSDIKKSWEQVIGEMAKNATVPGFRKGQAPSHLVADKLNTDQVREEVIKKLLPAAYTKAVTENKLKPIMNPKIHVEKLTEGEDWVFHALTTEMPEVKIGDYKDKVKTITAKSKILLPGKEEPKKPSLQEIIAAVLSVSDATIPSVLIEQEADRLLSKLLDDVKRLGLSLDQYLASTKRTAEDLRAEYAKKAAEDIKLEFVLAKISEQEKIIISDKEIEEAIQKAKSPEEKQNLEQNKYTLAGILRQQKTLDFLMGL